MEAFCLQPSLRPRLLASARASCTSLSSFAPSSLRTSWRQQQLPGTSQTYTSTFGTNSDRSASKRSKGFLRSAAFRAHAAMASTVKEVAVGGKPGVSLQVYPDMEALSRGLAEYLKEVSTEALTKKPAFTLVLSGGSLVKALGTMASYPEYKEAMDWTRWHVFWADERVVPLDHPDSNYKAANEEFLSKVPIPLGQVYSINDKVGAEGAADDYETNLKHLVRTGVLSTSPDGTYPSFDVILLGMGPDGHLASLFPHHPLLKETSKWVAPITDSPKPPPERITLTLPVINAAAHVGFVATGAGKASQLPTVFGDPVPEGSLPAQLVYPNKGQLVWFVDEPAAASVLR